MNKKIRFRNNNNKKYIAEFIDYTFIPQEKNGFIKPIVMLRIWDEQKKECACVTFTEHLLIDSVWTQPDKKPFPTKYKIEALVNLLHYLPFNFEEIKKYHPKCFEYQFDRDFSERKSGRLYTISAADSFEETFQRIIFGDNLTNKKIQDATAEIMFNYWEDNPDTNISVELLLSILPLTKVNLIKNLKILLEEDKIRAVVSPSNPQELISVGLKPSLIRELDGEVKPSPKYQKTIKHIYGPNIESTTYGPNSPINIDVEKIETVFKGFQKEIDKHPTQQNKNKISKTVEKLEIEVTKNKNPERVKKLLNHLKNSANWLYKKILLNPYVSGIIVEILMRKAKV
jgi:hypothetical protein